MNQIDFNLLVQRIAQQLGKDWRFDQREDPNKHARPYARLIGQRGMFLHFRIRWDKSSMCQVSGGWPKINNRQIDPRSAGVIKADDSFPGANFSLNRKPHLIAADIKRRVLISYVDYFDACMEYRKQRMAHLQAIQHKVNLLKNVGGLSVTKHNPEDDVYLRKYNGPAIQGSQDYRVSSYSGEVMIDIRYANIELAIKIASLIKDHYDEIAVTRAKDTND